MVTGPGGVEAVLIFSSTHHMLLAEQVLLDGGLDIDLVPAPKGAGELCTTAIRYYAAHDEKVRDLLAERHVEVKLILPYHRSRSLKPVQDPRRIAGMLGARNAEARAIMAEAERITDRVFGSRVSIMAIVGQDGSGIREAGDLAIPLLLIAPGTDEPDWPLLSSMLTGARFITTALVRRLNSEKIDNYRSCGVHYFLKPDSELKSLSDTELAEELIFLRDNHSGLVGTGYMIPLLAEETMDMQEEQDRVAIFAAVARLVMPDAYIPAPVLTQAGNVSGYCNLCIVDGRVLGLAHAVRGLGEVLAERGKHLPQAVEKRCLSIG